LEEKIQQGKWSQLINFFSSAVILTFLFVHFGVQSLKGRAGGVAGLLRGEAAGVERCV
jgi:hypothetical protein